MTPPHALVSGASVAGPALAFWLARYGWRTTVVERAPSLRTGGQNVDIRGAGREVIRRMGLEDTVRAATTGEQGTRFVGADGRSVAEFPAGTSDSDGATAELEILRGDLARLLVERTDETSAGVDRAGTTYRWGDHVTALDDTGAAVDATFASGTSATYDVVVAADGIGSSTRGLVFGSEVVLRSLGMEMTWLTVPRTPTDDDWWRWFSAPGGRSVTLRPDPVGTVRAALSIMTPTDVAISDGRTPDEHKALTRDRFRGAGWETDRILAALDDDEVYHQQVGQVHAPRWTSGRVALVGDAAYCPSPVSGMGTSLALVGAYVLAGELAAHVDHRDAFAGYERVVRPYVDQAQDLPPGTPRVANPQTRLGIAAFHTVLRAAASRPGRRLTAGLLTPPADKITLPDYAHLEVAQP